MSRGPAPTAVTARHAVTSATIAAGPSTRSISSTPSPRSAAPRRWSGTPSITSCSSPVSRSLSGSGWRPRPPGAATSATGPSGWSTRVCPIAPSPATWNGAWLPVDDLGPGKRIYVWFDAVIGYLSASKEWAASSGDPDAWRLWWEDPEAESYYFVGKDNIPFHTVIWPAMLMGYGDLNLPTDVPANQYVTFGSKKASASRGVGRSIGWYASRLEPDALRYALASVLPEHQDTDLSDEEIIRRVNEELVATWGNLVNRVLTMSHRNFDGVVPTPGELDPEDEEVERLATLVLERTAEAIEKVELRAGLRVAMEAASEVNAYLNATEPWRLLKTDRERAATVLWTAIQAIAGIRVALHPYLPHTSAVVGEMLGLGGEVGEWSAPGVPDGQPLGEIVPLFAKLDETVLDD